MAALVALALKSLVIAGFGLVLLRLMQRRSPAQRSWVAHITLLALLFLPFAPWALPELRLEAPKIVSSAADRLTRSVTPETPVKAESSIIASKAKVIAPASTDEVTAPSIEPATIDWTRLAYWTPAILLLVMTLLAVARLVALRSRADVLVDGHWLEALARAQRRMGFKHGTALLVSDELGSPISWGLVRPVILLNSRAVEATDDAEAIIAHELAHVARLDWLKLLLARVVTAVFWFNPLVWLLAREAHQLREETADDAVLDAQIPDTDYAELLVGVARHECNGMLIGAHGVAPSKGSLSRRIARVLDNSLARGPAPRSFAAGVFVGAAALAAPLAALTFSPAPASKSDESGADPYYSASGGVVSDFVSHAVAMSVAGAVGGLGGGVHPEDQADFDAELQKSIGKNHRDEKPAIEMAIEMKAVGATPEYARALQAVAPRLGSVSNEELVELAALGVSPAYIRELSDSGYRNLSADDIVEARALNVRGSYIKAMAAAGYPNLTMDELVEMKAVGVTPADVQALARAGYRNLTAEQLVEFKAVGDGRKWDRDKDDPDPDADPM